MNPNITFDETSDSEFDVIFHGKQIGAVWFDEDGGTWWAHDNRDTDGEGGFDTKEDAADWLIGW